MNNRILAGLTLTGVVILASCGQDITPTTSVPAAPSFARAPSCSFSTINNDAKAYFRSSKDDAFGLIDAMNTAYKAGGAADAVTPGFAVLARIGVAANNGASQVKGTPATSAGVGNTLVNDLLLCMKDYPTNLNFTSALGATGLFGVRYGGTTTAVIARNLDANGVPQNIGTNGVPISGTPLYGAEPYSVASSPAPTWPFSGPLLFYGNTLGASSIAGQQAAGTLFDLKTMPVVTFTSPIRAGVCDVTNTAARTLHRHTELTTTTTVTTTVIVPPAGVPGFCTSPPGLTASRGSFTQMLASLFTPKPLYAFLVSGGGTGLIRGLSEIGPVIFTDSLAFQGNISDAAVSDTIKTFDNDTLTTLQFSSVIKVRAVSKGAVLPLVGGKLPLVGVTLTLQIVGNNGSYVEAPLAKRTAVTDADGYARFPNYFIDKSGGYQVQVRAEEFGLASAVTSNSFIVSGQ
jgi:hypothetical protein